MPNELRIHVRDHSICVSFNQTTVPGTVLRWWGWGRQDSVLPLSYIRLTYGSLLQRSPRIVGGNHRFLKETTKFSKPVQRKVSLRLPVESGKSPLDIRSHANPLPNRVPWGLSPVPCWRKSGPFGVHPFACSDLTGRGKTLKSRGAPEFNSCVVGNTVLDFTADLQCG